MEITRQVLMWCTIINCGLLLWWFGWFVFAKELIYRIHSRWFTMSKKDFEAIHYLGMATFKIGILLFNLVPWIALSLSS